LLLALDNDVVVLEPLAAAAAAVAEANKLAATAGAV
jgi:hypothetical protein